MKPTDDVKQAASTEKNLAACLETKYYGRNNFNKQFSARVDPINHQITLIMGVEFSFGTGWNIRSPEEQEKATQAMEKFKRDFKSVVEQTWSSQYAFHSNCHSALDKYNVRVEIWLDAQDPHTKLTIYGDSIVSRAGKQKSNDFNTGQLSVDDNTPEEHKWKPKNNKGKEALYQQVTSAHEFGHLIGLSHIKCADNRDDCYGVTPEQLTDIMGKGSYVSGRDYEPFKKIIQLFGKECLPPSCRDWRLVDPG